MIEEHLSVHQVSVQQQQQQEPEYSTLSECFQLYTQEETVSDDSCQHRQLVCQTKVTFNLGILCSVFSIVKSHILEERVYVSV